MFKSSDIEELKVQIHRFLNRNMGTILTYHSVDDVPLEFDMWTHIPVHLFEEHMSFLKAEANVISLEEMTQAIRNGKLQKYSVALTFDDGYRNNFTRAYPILKKYQIPATIFLSTGYMDKSELFWPERVAYQLMRTEKKLLKYSAFGALNFEPEGARREAFSKIKETLKELHPYTVRDKVCELEGQLEVPCNEDDPLYREWLPLTWGDVQRMDDEGLVSFGGHTVNHAILSRLDDSEAYREIVDCRASLDDHLSKKTPLWAYPNGTFRDFKANHVEMLERNGFSTILTTDSGYVGIQSDIRMLTRIGVGSKMRSTDINALLAKRGVLSQHKGINKITTIFRCAAGV